ncbi:hypothetical protein FKM82_003492 [Ascaphus truei]
MAGSVPWHCRKAKSTKKPAIFRVSYPSAHAQTRSPPSAHAQTWQPPSQYHHIDRSPRSETQRSGALLYSTPEHLETSLTSNLFKAKDCQLATRTVPYLP